MTKAAELKRYISKIVYGIAKDAKVLKLAVLNELRPKFDRCYTVKSVRLFVANYEAAA